MLPRERRSLHIWRLVSLLSRISIISLDDMLVAKAETEEAEEEPSHCQGIEKTVTGEVLG